VVDVAVALRLRDVLAVLLALLLFHVEARGCLAVEAGGCAGGGCEGGSCGGS
jgi:hypothetical protein